MNCPNCNKEHLATIETFQTPDQTIRTKKCKVCNWTFTSKEEIADEVVIPKVVRNLKRKIKEVA